MVVVVDGVMVKTFGIEDSAREYAATMMRKQHDVWLMNKKTAANLGFI